PLVLPAEDAAYVHGMDGFGDAGLVPARRAASAEHAALAIVRLARAHPGELTLVALGPLTNLALALRLDPELPSRIARLVVMGGAVTGRGNTSVSAEFNVGFDPEAAHVVFSNWPMFELVDWEATVRHALDFDAAERWFACGDPRATFYEAISRKTRAFNKERERLGLIAADALAMAVVVDPAIVVRAEERHVAVELGGTLTRGATIVDWERRGGHAPNARIVLEVDHARFAALVASALGAA
ncbi:MAG TPA: nucleoside hydrolase, partial [Tahibacter sp.]|nr:nucleoside hydrolase [Tahibacter sp.]